MTSANPDSSTSVSTTFALTLSPTPRKFTSMTRAMKARATSRIMTGAGSSMPSPLARFAAKARAAVEAEVMPEHMTVKQTMNVTKWMPNALWVYSAAPAACGYFVTSSR